MSKIWPVIWAAAFAISFTISWVLQGHAGTWFIVVDVRLPGISDPQQIRHEKEFPDKPACETYVGSKQFADEVERAHEYFKSRGVLAKISNPKCMSLATKMQEKMPDHLYRDRA